MSIPKKIILISLDTLRADHMGCYGYCRPTTPHLDHLAQESIVFKNAFSPSSHTIPSHGSIFTGKLPSRHSIGFNQNIFMETGRLDTDVDITIAEILKNSGYSTAAFIGGIVLGKKTNFNAGFDVYDDDIRDDPFGRRRCSDTNDTIIPWLDENHTRDFFIFIHYFDIHGPYICPENYSDLFLRDSVYSASPIPEKRYDTSPLTDAVPNYQLLRTEKNENGSLVSYERDLGYYVAQYDSCIRYLDDNIGILVNKLKELGIYDDTLIIVTSDHGEAFGENDIYFYHGLTVTLDQIKVPLLFKPHRGWEIGASQINDPVSTLDIFPTLLSLINIDYEKYDLDGISILPLSEGNYCPDLQHRIIISENEGQVARISSDGVLTFRKKEIPTSNFYPSIPVLLDALNGKKIYWENGVEYLQTLPFDEYQRYRIIADIINKYRKGTEVFTVLDVGSGVRETLQKFLPTDRVTNLDKEVPENLRGKPRYIEMDITRQQVPGTYDFVVSVDTFEHIPGELREKFLEALLQPALIATIVACPFDTPGVRECEENANDLYRSVYGEDYSWLKEHIQYGLPSLQSTIEVLQTSAVSDIALLPNGSLSRWLRLIRLYLGVEQQPGIFKDLSPIWEFYNTVFYDYDNIDPSYRKVIIIQKQGKVPDFTAIRSTQDFPRIRILEEILDDLINELSRNLQNRAVIPKSDTNQRDLFTDESSSIPFHVPGSEQLITKKNHYLAELSDQVSRIELHARGLEQMIREKDHEISGQKTHILEIDKKTEELIALLEDKQREISGLYQQISILTKEKQDLNIHAYGLEQRNQQKDEYISALTDQVRQIKQHAQGLERQLEKKERSAQLLRWITRVIFLEKKLHHDPYRTETNINSSELLEKIDGTDGQETLPRNSDKNPEESDASPDEKGNEISGLFHQVKTLTKERDDLCIHISGLVQQIQQKDEYITALSNQVREIEKHAKGLEQKLSIKENRERIRQQISGIINPYIDLIRGTIRLGKKSASILMHGGVAELIKKYHERKAFLAGQNFSQKSFQVTTKAGGLEEIDVSSFAFPEKTHSPDVSIVIPVHNQIHFTLNCLNSIAKKTHESYEIIVVDDASSDSTKEVLAKIRNITTITNEENAGFIRSCNAGADASCGKYVLFLNNDTLVTENWLSPLLDIISRDDTGAVGSKLVYPDGRLQEAGGIIWNDASGWNYGRGDDALKPEYNFVRSVDYCSGASLLVKKDLFHKTGGFDERFIPAYYEDADLCFSIRKLGYKVMYQPLSVVIHFEGISSGTDLSSGVKKHQIINKQKFFEKWKDVLLAEHRDPGLDTPGTARSHVSGKRILVIDQYVPFFDRDAGSYRMSNILKILADLGHRVTFIGDNFNQFEPYDSIMQQSGIEVVYSPFITSIRQYLSESGAQFDVVLISRPYIAEKHIEDIRKYCHNAKIVYDTVDLAYVRELRRADVENDPQIRKKAEEIKKVELEMARKSDVTLVVSTSEKETLQKEDPSLNVQVISLIHTIIESTKPFTERRDLLFLGAFLHVPNVDAALWFIREIFPRIRVLEPGIRIFIVGDRPPSEILALSSDDVIVTGYVKDLSGYFNDCRVFVAPLRYGAGVKGKINQSMSRGLPVVTTHIGAEGMGINDGEHVLIADDPEVFAQKVLKLYRDEDLWKTIAVNATEHIRQNTSFEQSKIRIREFINHL